jgi:hypothetical protein
MGYRVPAPAATSKGKNDIYIRSCYPLICMWPSPRGSHLSLDYQKVIVYLVHASMPLHLIPFNIIRLSSCNHVTI